MAGQGSCAVEIADQCQALGVRSLDSLLIPMGGGGLAAGCCLAMQKRMPQCRLYGVEPEGYDDHVRSLAAGCIVPLTESPSSLCDALQAVAPGRNTFPINQRLLSGAFAVSDEQVGERKSR
jgi:threonine dehydratase